jgi:predicted protein tyrosine phosphatase
MNILFVCTVNRMRSCTAEALYGGDARYSVMSAGTAPGATRRISPELVLWADRIFVMEAHHEEYIRHEFPAESAGKQIIVLGIPDIYYFMDPELIMLLRSKLPPLLET